MSAVIFRPAAEADLVSIALFVAESSVDRAEKVVRRLRTRCKILEAHPHAGRTRPEFGPDLRALVEHPYVIVYRLNGASPEIVSIVHGARDLPTVIAARIRDETGEGG